MRTLFVAGIAPIVRDMTTSQRFYVDDLGLPLAGDYPSSDRLDGVKHFGLWSLQEAARACFGQDHWPADIPTPQGSLEFDVDDVTAAAGELEGKGYTLLHPAKREPWGQTICRLLSPEGLLVGLSHTPWMRSDGSPSDEPHAVQPMMKSRTINISIARPAAQVYDFVSDPEHLPRWIASATVRKAGNEWVMEAPTGSMGIRVVAQNAFGVVDHVVTLPDGQPVLNPIRVLPNGSGSEVVFTLFQHPGMSDQRFAEDAMLVEADLRLLKRILEA